MMTIYLLLVAVAFVVAVTLGLIMMPKILFISYKKRLFDMPNKRKVHDVPIPRLGGLSFFPVTLVVVCLSIGLCYYIDLPPDEFRRTPYEYLFFLVGCMLLYIIGVADDLVGVSYRYKFVVQIVTAALLVFTGDWISSLGGLFGIHDISPWVGKPFTVLIIVYITNAINLIDGIDGLASGLSSIALFSLGILFTYRGEWVFVMLATATLGVLMPFWFYNVFGNAFRGHKLFMGDTGSLTLGFILSFMVVHVSDSSVESYTTRDVVIAFSTLLVPLLDVMRVVVGRLRDGKNPFLPDKRHIHHKLQRTGMRIRMILVTILAISLFFIAFNMLLIPHVNITILLIMDVAIWVGIQIVINMSIKTRGYKNKAIS